MPDIRQYSDEDLTRLRDEQFLTTARILQDATKYYSDSILDPVNAACDAAEMLNNLVYDDDREGLHRWITDDENGLSTLCSEGLCEGLYIFLPEED